MRVNIKIVGNGQFAVGSQATNRIVATLPTAFCQLPTLNQNQIKELNRWLA